MIREVAGNLGPQATRTVDHAGGSCIEVGTRESSTYDDAGQIDQVNDVAASTVLRDYDYDAFGRRSQVSTPDGVTTYGWDPIGQLASTAGPDGTTTYAYDGAGRRIHRHRSNGTVSTNYSWGVDGRLAGQERLDAAGATISSESRRYDANQLLTEIDHTTGGATESVELTWDTTLAIPHISNWTHTDGAGTTELSFNQNSVGGPNTSDHSHAFDRYGSALDVADPADYAVTAAGRFDEFGNPLQVDLDPLDLVDTQGTALRCRRGRQPSPEPTWSARSTRTRGRGAGAWLTRRPMTTAESPTRMVTTDRTLRPHVLSLLDRHMTTTHSTKPTHSGCVNRSGPDGGSGDWISNPGGVRLGAAGFSAGSSDAVGEAPATVEGT